MLSNSGIWIRPPAGKRAIRMLICFVAFFFLASSAVAGSLPDGFVYVDEVIPDAVVDLRYHSENNFVGRIIDGYGASHCILTKEAARALKKVQLELKRFGLGLKIFDAYRPQRAVDHFVRWAKDLDDDRMKDLYYPEVDKKDLFSKGYIAAKSSHSRGSTVDVTIVYKDPKGDYRELDMGSGFDFFSPVSWPTSPSVGPVQRAHRMLLQTLMVQNGFAPYAQEWWHFTLKDEPFPNDYFDFPIE